MSVLDDLKKVEATILKRYQELLPALQEMEELRRAADRLGMDLEGDTAHSAAPASADTRGPLSTRPPRRRRSERREQVLALVNERPGITVPEVGRELNVDPTGLYRVVRQLEEDGYVSKKNKHLHPVTG